MEIKNLNKRINHNVVLKDISFTLDKGEIAGLIGRNGTGKTTLFRLIANHYSLDSGDILIHQQSIYEDVTLKERVFFLDDQYNVLSNQTPKSLETFYKELYTAFDSEKYYSLLKKHHLETDRKVKHFSKGIQALYKMILAFSTNADFYIFDEPFDGLDMIVKKRVIQLLLNEVNINQCGILISSHNLLELENIIDKALVLQDQTISKEYVLENIRESIKKYQMVFRKKTIPGIVKANSNIIQVQGRVVIGIFEDMTEELYADIQSLDPVLFEELPINLEDIFASNFTNESDYQLFN